MRKSASVRGRTRLRLRPHLRASHAGSEGGALRCQSHAKDGRKGTAAASKLFGERQRAPEPRKDEARRSVGRRRGHCRRRRPTAVL
eukprot:6598318-Alexandrium_andersonii.AAC.1